MRALIQRVSQARVDIDGKSVGQTGAGLLVFICAMGGDVDDTAEYLARKIGSLRIFEDDAGKMNLSVSDIGGAALVVSQFTLAADTSRGNRPGFLYAASPNEGRRLYELFSSLLSEQGVPVETGSFGADMEVHLVNDGPVTIWMDTEGKT